MDIICECPLTAILYGFDTEMTACCNDKDGPCDTELNNNADVGNKKLGEDGRD